jgi:hypothetical protein
MKFMISKVVMEEKVDNLCWDYGSGALKGMIGVLTFGLAGLAQLAARQSHNLKVESSILSLRKRFFDFFNYT